MDNLQVAKKGTDLIGIEEIDNYISVMTAIGDSSFCRKNETVYTGKICEAVYVKLLAFGYSVIPVEGKGIIISKKIKEQHGTDPYSVDGYVKWISESYLPPPPVHPLSYPKIIYTGIPVEHHDAIAKKLREAGYKVSPDKEDGDLTVCKNTGQHTIS